MNSPQHDMNTSKNNKSFLLNNGVEIPAIGMGTGLIRLNGFRSIIGDIVKRHGKEIRESNNLYNILKYSVNQGGRLFDTSRAYGKSEEILGNAIKDFNRDKIFIITKLSNTDQRSGDIRKALLKSMNALGVEYIDLYLIHWPQPETYLNSWIQLEDLYKEGLVKAIGVSNFHKHHIEKLLSVATIMPTVNEIEVHPLMNQKPLVKYCQELGIRVVAYTPLGRMHDKILNNTNLIEIAHQKKRTVSQIILRWHYQNDIISIPHTKKTSRFNEYMDIFDFSLSDDEMIKINEINENHRLRFDPDNCDFSKL